MRKLVETRSNDAYFFEKYAFYFCLKIICLEVLAISKQELQINEEIRDREILVIDQNGTKLGTMSARDAQKLAYEQDLDLVKIAPQAGKGSKKESESGFHQGNPDVFCNRYPRL